MPGEKAKNFRGTIGKLMKYIGSYRIGIIAVLIFAIGSTLFNIVGPKILSRAITVLYEGVMNQLSGAAPCQCLTPTGMFTTSPG